MPPTEKIDIKIPPTAWRPQGEGDDPTSSLIAKPILSIAGVSMHLEAFAVDYRGEGNEMYFVEDPADERIGLLWRATSTEGPFDTTEINGREYVIIAYPHT
jgi:hypothetical protein